MKTRSIYGAPGTWLMASVLMLVAVDAEAQAPVTPPVQQPAQSPGAAGQTEDFVKLGDGDVGSPFATETVLKLNAIVRRSKAAIDGYDAVRAAARADVDAAAKPGAPAAVRDKANADIARIKALCADADAARADMAAAKAVLEAGKEKYNGDILAGMVGFTIDVETELANAATELTAKLAGK